jgi:hypothetical protein
MLCDFCEQKNSMQRTFIKNISCLWWEVFVTSSGKYFADNEEVETEVRKWLRQQSKGFYAAGFDTLLKRRDKCINAGGGGGYVEK